MRRRCTGFPPGWTEEKYANATDEDWEALPDELLELNMQRMVTQGHRNFAATKFDEALPDTGVQRVQEKVFTKTVSDECMSGMESENVALTTAGLNRSPCPRLAYLQVEIWATVLNTAPAKSGPTIPAVYSSDG
ncbi:hypothetical protein V500_11340 [Pseudogymnoascus sp. VKM F-4518 (FW-2643)]|nr:hypothetical protein V500_11340 [Pseudogymnoascus sp. VKM F-4518 (FW-2643)]